MAYSVSCSFDNFGSVGISNVCLKLVSEFKLILELMTFVSPIPFGLELLSNSANVKLWPLKTRTHLRYCFDLLNTLTCDSLVRG